MITNRLAYFGCLMVAVAATVAVRLTANDTEVSAATFQDGVERLSSAPASFGEWQLKSDQQLDDRTVKILRCAGHLNRRYANTATGEVVDLILLVGPAGPLLAHTPDVCMESREFEQIEASGPVAISDTGNARNVFLKTAYRARTLEGQNLRLYYGWSRDLQKWEGPDQPRMAMGDAPMLYKMQVSSVKPSSSTAEDATVESSDACQRFLADLISNWN